MRWAAAVLLLSFNGCAMSLDDAARWTAKLERYIETGDKWAEKADKFLDAGGEVVSGVRTEVERIRKFEGKTELDANAWMQIALAILGGGGILSAGSVTALNKIRNLTRERDLDKVKNGVK